MQRVEDLEHTAELEYGGHNDHRAAEITHPVGIALVVSAHQALLEHPRGALERARLEWRAEPVRRGPG